MITTEVSSSPVQTNISVAASTFSIKASARAFQILSGFYSEPILAIPRELGANAWDAHVKAGTTDKQFIVHAPNVLEPWFSIRDFGTGISPEDIYKVYTTFFESTKTEDNDTDGCMGLGSKTPLYYAKNFTVMSFYNKKKYVYSCFINEKGVPSIIPMATDDTDEENGLFVKFAVETKDISNFNDKIKRAYQSFKHRPKIVGETITYEKEEILKQGTNWSLTNRSSGYRYSTSSRAFMGNYSYPIETRPLYTELDKIDRAERNQIEAILNAGFDFSFNIGELDVAPNKEQLQYDGTRTAKSIIARCKVAFKELREQIQQEIKVPKTRWEAMILHTEYNAYNSPYYHLRSIIGGIKVTFNNKEVESHVRVSTVHKENGLITADPVRDYYSYAADDAGRKKKEEDHNFTSTYSLSEIGIHPNSGNFKFTSTNQYVVSSGKEMVIFYTDQFSVKRARIKHYLDTLQSKQLAQNPHAGTKLPQMLLVVDTSTNFSTLKKHQAYFGWEDKVLVHVESLPKPPRPQADPNAVKIDTTGYVDVATIPNDIDQYWTGPFFSRQNIKIEPTDVNYYVDMHGFTYQYEGKDLEKSTVALMVRYAMEYKILPSKVNIVAIHKKDKRLLKAGTWHNLFDLVEEHIKSKDQIKLVREVLFLRENETCLNEFGRIPDFLRQNTEYFDRVEDKKLRELFEKINKLREDINNQKNYRYVELYKLFDIKSKENASVKKLVESFRKHAKTYEILFKITHSISYWNDEESEAVFDMINFINKHS